MAIHTELEIYKVSYDLMGLAVDLIKNMQRAVRPVVGDRLRDECLAVLTCIQRANMAQDKEPHLLVLNEHIETANALLRVSRDKRIISTGQYARAIELTGSIGKQATHSHKDRTQLARLVRQRGHAVDLFLTKAYL